MQLCKSSLKPLHYNIDSVPVSKKYLGRPAGSIFCVCWSILKCLNKVAVTFCGVIGCVFGVKWCLVVVGGDPRWVVFGCGLMVVVEFGGVW